MDGYKVSESRKPVSNLGVTADYEGEEVRVLDTQNCPLRKKEGFRPSSRFPGTQKNGISIIKLPVFYTYVCVHGLVCMMEHKKRQLNSP